MTHPISQTLFDYYRLPTDSVARLSCDIPSGGKGFFRFGPETVCYGQCGSGVAPKLNRSTLPDSSQDVDLRGSEVHLPFDPTQVVENFRLERYVKEANSDKQKLLYHALTRRAYYSVRELLPVFVRRHLQRAYVNDWRELSFPRWPVDLTVDALHLELLRLSMEAQGVRKVPFIWFWPEAARSCLIMTHDVETAAGRDFSSKLMDLDASYGINASFQVIPEKRYSVPDEYVREIRSRGFEFNVHDLNHDGHLFQEREEFLRRAKKINEYVRKYEARGFRSGSMYRRPDWFEAFAFSYDMSVPNVAHLEAQRGGCCTVMPYFIGNILELPLTTCQDYSILHILNDDSIDIWKEQLDLITNGNGLISFNVHPDYLILGRGRKTFETLLDHLRTRIVEANLWAALPRDVDRWWRARSQMRLVARGNDWEIEGPEKERARLAYAVLDSSGRVAYEFSELPIHKDARS